MTEKERLEIMNQFLETNHYQDANGNEVICHGEEEDEEEGFFDINQHNDKMRQYREKICRKPSYEFHQDELKISHDWVEPLKISAVVKILTCTEYHSTNTYHNLDKDEHAKIMSTKACLNLTGLGLSDMSIFPVAIMTSYFDIDSLEEFKLIYKPGAIFLIKGEYRISMQDSEVFVVGPDVTLLPPETVANLDRRFDDYYLNSDGN